MKRERKKRGMKRNRWKEKHRRDKDGKEYK